MTASVFERDQIAWLDEQERERVEAERDALEKEVVELRAKSASATIDAERNRSEVVRLGRLTISLRQERDRARVALSRASHIVAEHGCDDCLTSSDNEHDPRCTYMLALQDEVSS